MANRFTDTEKWKDDWFLELEPSMKMLWLYILDSCDHAGFWKVNFKLATYCIGGNTTLFDRQSALKAFDGRVSEIEKNKWHVTKFIAYQYGKKLNSSNNAHRGVLKLLKSNGIETRGYQVGEENTDDSLGDKDKDKDKDSSSILNSSFKNKSALKIDEVIQLFNDTLAIKKIGKIDFCHGLSGNQLQEFITTTSFKEFRSIETWRELFNRIANSEFLNGSSGNFVATLNWTVKHDNALKVLNGQYNGTPEPQKSSLTAFKSKSHGVASTPQNPTGNPYIQEAIEKGYIA
jgi:hypothetical protein